MTPLSRLKPCRVYFVLLLRDLVLPSVWQPRWPVLELPVSPVLDLWQCSWSSRRLGFQLRISASWSLSTGCCKFNINTVDIFKTYNHILGWCIFPLFVFLNNPVDWAKNLPFPPFFKLYWISYLSTAWQLFVHLIPEQHICSLCGVWLNCR